jgi:hypothetical protein
VHESSRGKNVCLIYDFVSSKRELKRIVYERWVGLEIACERNVCHKEWSDIGSSLLFKLDRKV